MITQGTMHVCTILYCSAYYLTEDEPPQLPPGIRSHSLSRNSCSSCRIFCSVGQTPAEKSVHSTVRADLTAPTVRPITRGYCVVLHKLRWSEFDLPYSVAKTQSRLSQVTAEQVA